MFVYSNSTRSALDQCRLSPESKTSKDFFSPRSQHMFFTHDDRADYSTGCSTGYTRSSRYKIIQKLSTSTLNICCLCIKKMSFLCIQILDSNDVTEKNWENADATATLIKSTHDQPASLQLLVPSAPARATWYGHCR